MKKIIFFSMLMFSFILEAQVISHSKSMALNSEIGSCFAGQTGSSGANNYFRFFNLSTFSITSDYTISSVQFGVALVQTGTLPNGIPVTVNIYSTASSNFPTGFPTGYSLLASVTTYIVAADVGNLKSVPINAIIPLGSKLLVEVRNDPQPSSGNYIILSSNELGQSAPTYYMSCFMTAPATLPGNSSFVLSVTGNLLNINNNELNKKTSVYPNPTKGLFSISLPSPVTIEEASLTDISGKQMNLKINSENNFDISKLNSGVYFLKVVTN